MLLITAEPCMESATCCGMELIAKQSYGIKPQKNAPLVMPYAQGRFHTRYRVMPYQACGLYKKYCRKCILFCNIFWCGRRDSNPHGVTHRNLKPARLPISPRPRILRKSLLYDFRLLYCSVLALYLKGFSAA